MFNGILYFGKYCWKFDKIYIILLFIRQVLTSFLLLISLLLPRNIIDSLFIRQNIKESLVLVGILIILTSLMSLIKNVITNKILIHRMFVFKKFQIYLGNLVMNTDFYKLESKDYLSIREKAYKYLYGNGSGFAQILEDGFNIFGYVISMIGMAAIVSKFDLRLVVFMIIIVLINTFSDNIIKKRNIKLNLERTVHERRSSYFSNIFSDFRYGKDVRIYNISKWLISKYDTQLEYMQTIYKKIAKNNIKLGYVQVITGVLQQTIMYSYIIINIVKGYVSIGDFTMFLNTINQFVNTLNSFTLGILDLRRYSDYYESFKCFLKLNQNNETRCGEIKPNLDLKNLSIEFVNVSFKYQGQKEYALKNISIKLPLNQKISIVGENGTGKSTFIKLLTRIYYPTEGKILLNGYNINDIQYDYYMSLFSTVFQDYKLFSMPILDNIILNNQYNKEEFDNVLNEAGLKNKMKQLKNGINTFVYKDFNNEGFEPSGGESQKLAISRALYRNSKIIILDEPTAALDPKAEIQLYNQFNKLFKDKSILFISHRLSVNLFCDYILVFKSGEIVEKGTHNYLLKLKGLYYELYSLQSQFYTS